MGECVFECGDIYSYLCVWARPRAFANERVFAFTRTNTLHSYTYIWKDISMSSWLPMYVLYAYICDKNHEIFPYIYIQQNPAQ